MSHRMGGTNNIADNKRRVTKQYQYSVALPYFNPQSKTILAKSDGSHAH